MCSISKGKGFSRQDRTNQNFTQEWEVNRKHSKRAVHDAYKEKNGRRMIALECTGMKNNVYQ
jgi:hypothetical protein